MVHEFTAWLKKCKENQMVFKKYTFDLFPLDLVLSGHAPQWGVEIGYIILVNSYTLSMNIFLTCLVFWLLTQLVMYVSWYIPIHAYKKEVGITIKGKKTNS